jgi:hypothetical protein
MGPFPDYRLPDFDWSAFYRVVVRGIGPTSIEAVQVDLAGFLRIRNGTTAAYPGARISVSARMRRCRRGPNRSACST